MARAGYVEVNQIGAPFVGDKAKNLLYQVPVRIKERKAFAVQGVLTSQIRHQRGLSGSRFADDVHVGASVGALDAKANVLVAEVGFAHESNLVMQSKICHRLMRYVE